MILVKDIDKIEIDVFFILYCIFVFRNIFAYGAIGKSDIFWLDCKTIKEVRETGMLRVKTKISFSDFKKKGEKKKAFDCG